METMTERNSTVEAPSPPRRKRRRWPLLLVFLAGAIYAAPWILSINGVAQRVTETALPWLPPGSNIGKPSLGWMSPVHLAGLKFLDEHGRVRGLEHEYAAGDAVDFPVKHGGLASQQADAAARDIAAAAGAGVEPEPFEPVVHGLLLTGGRPLYLTAAITGGHGFTSEISDEPRWDKSTKVVSKYLAPYLEAQA